jgi:hypothetical protein
LKNSKYYQEISRVEYFQLKNSHYKTISNLKKYISVDVFSDFELKNILGIIGDSDIRSPYWIRCYRSIRIDRILLNIIDIGKISDEYYIVEKFESSGKSYWYKCDQLDGLLKCLEEIKN